jgi:hypothetical protein
MLAGRLNAPGGIASLTLEARPGGGLAGVSLGTVPVDADGGFSMRVTPSSTTEYRVSVPPYGGFGAGSASVVVSVRRVVRLNWPTSVVHVGRVGAHVAINAAISAVAAGVSVAFRLERWSTVSRSWQLVGTLNRRTDTSGRANVVWTPSSGAPYRWRATAGWTPEYATGSSPWVRWSIRR